MHTHNALTLRRRSSALLLTLLTVPAIAVPAAAAAPALPRPSLRIETMIAGVGGEAKIEGWAPEETISLSLQTPSGHRKALAPLTADATGKGRTTLRGRETEEAGDYSLRVDGEAGGRAEYTFTVLPDTLDTRLSSLRVLPSWIVANDQETATVIVTLTDAYGNPLEGRPVTLISSIASDRITPPSRATDAEGQQRFLLSARTQGERSIRALDVLSSQILESAAILHAADDAVGGHDTRYGRRGARFGDDDPYPPRRTSRFRADLLDRASAQDLTGGFGIVDAFVPELPSSLKAGQVASLTITAVDARGDRAEDYVGTVRIESPTDPDAVLPGLVSDPRDPDDVYGEVTFSRKNLGRKMLPFSVSFSRPGRQVLRVIDDADPRRPIEGSIEVLVTGEAIDDGHRIQILSPRNGRIKNGRFTLEGIGPRHANILVSEGGEEIAMGESNGSGSFRIPITLRAGKSEYTLRVKDETGRFDSGKVDLTFDSDPPIISAVSVTPREPEEQSRALFLVTSEPALAKVTTVIGTETLTLSEDPKKPGTYQSLFIAPAAGSVQTAVTAEDDAGNMMMTLHPLVVVARNLPKVEGVRAFPRASAVELRWSPVKGVTVTSYSIYWGENLSNLESIDTQKNATGAIVFGLKPQTTYVFQVTARSGGRESLEKSEPVSAAPIGMSLAAEPLESAVKLRWQLPETAPLSAFLLAYGTEPGEESEKRLLNGLLREWTVRDLLPGITYHFRLTPLTISGDLLSDLSAEAQATVPFTTVMRPSGSTDEGLIDPDAIPPDEGLHRGAGGTPGTGLPKTAWWFIGSATLLLVFLRWHAVRARRRTESFLRMMERRYHQR